MPKASSAAGRSSGSLDGVLPKIRIPLMQRGSLLHKGKTEDLFIIDLALAGVFVEREEPIEVGEMVEVRFRLPGNEIPVSARCRVAWWHPESAPLVSKSLPPGMGLAFVEISDSDLAKIREQLAEHFRKQPGERRFSRQWLLADEEGEGS
jgi:Tfp pilus assembly protein PilZ